MTMLAFLQMLQESVERLQVLQKVRRQAAELPLIAAGAMLAVVIVIGNVRVKRPLNLQSFLCALVSN